MQRLWNTLVENVVFMMFVLPLVGAVLVLLSTRFGTDAIRRTVLTNVLLTFALALLMIFHYDPDRATDGRPQLYQMVSRLRWIAEERLEVIEPDAEVAVVRRTFHGPNVQFAVGVDGLSVWFVGLVSTLMIPAVLAGWDVDGRRPEVFYALLLALQSALIGTLAAIDLVLFAIGLEAASLLLFLLIGGWGGGERRGAARKFWLCHVAGGLLVLLGLLALVPAHSWMLRFATGSGESPLFTFSIPQLVQGAGGVPGIPALAASGDAAGAYWDQLAPGIFAVLLVGFALKLALVPFHTWLPPANAEAATSASVLLMGTLAVGGYGLVRFVIPLFPGIGQQASGLLTGLAVLAAVYSALLALAQGDLKKRMTYMGLSLFGLWVAATFSFNSAALAGGVLLALGTALALGILLVVAGAIERRYRTRDREAFGGLGSRHRRLAFWFAIGGLALAGLPGTSGFSGGLLAVLGVFHGNAATGDRLWAAFCSLVALLVILWALLETWERVFRGRLYEPMMPFPAVGDWGGGSATPQSHQGTPDRGFADSALGTQPRAPVADLTLREWVGLLPLAAGVLWIGLTPQFFIARMEPTVNEILRPNQGSRDERDKGRGTRGQGPLTVPALDSRPLPLGS